MIQRLLNVLFKKFRRRQNTPVPQAAPTRVRFREQALAKLSVQDWDPEAQRALHAAATSHANMTIYTGHVTHGYALRAVATPSRCPRCQAEARQQYANFIYATQVAPRVLFAPAGYFCLQCPTVIVDEEMIQAGIVGSFTFQGALGIAYDDRQEPDVFTTWNGQRALHIFDEHQTPQGLATLPPAQQPQRHKEREKSRGRQRMTKASRRRNRQKR